MNLNVFTFKNKSNIFGTLEDYDTRLYDYSLSKTVHMEQEIKVNSQKN